MTPERCEAVTDLLPAYLNGSLDVRQGTRVRTHLAECAACRQELAIWERLAQGTRAASPTVPPATEREMAALWARIDADHAGSHTRAPRCAWLWQVVVSQAALLRLQLGGGVALTVALGYLVTLLVQLGVPATLPLTVIAPALAALGVASLCSVHDDPVFELTLATPTSPRLVLLARLTLVYGVDLALALAVSVFLTATQTGDSHDLRALVLVWLGPMLFLSAIGLVLAHLWGTRAATAGTLLLWATHILTLSGPTRTILGDAAALMFDRFWQATPLLIGCTVAALALALALTPRAIETKHGRLPVGA